MKASRKSIIIGSFAAIAIIVIWALFYVRDLVWDQVQGEIRRSTEVAANQLEDRVKVYLSERLVALKQVGVFFENSDEVTEEEFGRFAGKTLENVPGIGAIEYVDQAYIVRQVYPRETIYQDYGRAISETEQAMLANAGSDLVVTDLMKLVKGQEFMAYLPLGNEGELIEGGVGFVVYVPVDKASQVVGYVRGVFRVEELLAHFLDEEIRQRFALHIQDSRGTTIYQSKNDVSVALREQRPIPVGDKQWTIEIGQLTSAIPVGTRIYDLSIFGSGFLFLSAVGILMWFLGRQSQRLEAEVERRTQALQEKTHDLESAQSQLISSEERYRQLVNGLDAIIWEANPRTGQFTFVSAQAEILLGYPVQQWLSDPDFRVKHLHPEDREPIADLWRAALRDRRDLECEYRMLTVDGRTVWLRDVMRVVSQNGQVSGIRGFMVDITQRHHAQEALRASERRFAQAFDASPIPLSLSTIKEGRIIDVNESFIRVMGYSREELIGRSARELDTWADFTQREEALRILEEEGSVRDMEILGRIKGGEVRSFLLSIEIVELDQEPCLLITTNDITERKRAEEALRTNEERFRQLAENIDAVFWVTSAKDKELMYVSPMFEKIWGRPLESLPDSWVEAIHEEDRPRVLAAMPKQLEGDYDEEYRIIRPDGTIRWIRDRAYPIRAATGQIARIVGIAEDFTERKRAEEALKESETWFRELFDEAPVAYHEVDTEGRVLRVNRTELAMLGYTAEEMLGQPIWEFITEHEASRIAIAAKMRGEGSFRPYERMWRRKDGTIFPALMEDRFIRDAEGNILGIRTAMQNITERKQSEEALQSSEERFRQLAENIDAVFWVTSAKDKELMYVSPMFEKIWGRPLESLPDSWVEAVHEEDRPRVLAAMPKQLEGDYDEEYRIIRPDGTIRWIRDRAYPIRGATGQIARIVGIAEDFTERKRAEEKLKQTASDLARSNAELEQFAYVASHDLQEPLRMVTSYVQLLSRRYQGKLGPDADEYISYAVDGATRMKMLINDLLTYSRVDTRGKSFEPTDLKAALNRALAFLHGTIEETGAIVTHDPLPTLMADSPQLVLLFQNLVGNAIKFRSEDRPEIHIGVKAQDHEWMLSVRDNGIGLEPQYAERVFLIFQRLHSKEKYPGTGIGLAICKRIVERHGGRIWVESELSQGATFYFTIPMNQRQ